MPGTAARLRDVANPDLKRLWPTIVDEQTAQRAARVGAVTIWLSAIATTVLSVVAMLRGPMGSITGWSLLDAATAGFIGWRVWKLSRAWAVLSLAAIVTNVAIRLSESDGHGRVSPVVLILLLGALNAVRGTFAYHRFRQKRTVTVAGVAQ